MQHDEVIWQIIRHNHCSFMSKIETGQFCRNPYNVTGICNRSSCPLANSRYATIRDHEGVFYLYMKTIERAHNPNKLWERVKLPKNYLKALEVIDKHLMYWPKLLVHKIKQRLTKMNQVRRLKKHLALKQMEKIMTMPRMAMKKDNRRMSKAEVAARIDDRVEEELLNRLKQGIPGYSSIPNAIPNWEEFLEKNEIIEEDVESEEEEVEVVEYVDGCEEEEFDIEDFGNMDMNMNMDDEEDENHGINDHNIVDDMEKGSRRTIKSNKKKGKVIVEVECDDASKITRLVH